MVKRKVTAETPREHFLRAFGDEFSKFERRERAFRQAERDERAARLKLPLDRSASAIDVCDARRRH
jgi:hypothetical protein